VIITRVSGMTGLTHEMDLDVTPEQFAHWESNACLVQDAFPRLTPDEREFLMTGTTAQEWEDAFGEEYIDVGR